MFYMFFSGAQPLCWAISHVSEKKRCRFIKLEFSWGVPKEMAPLYKGDWGLQKKEKSGKTRPKNTFLADPGLIDFIRIYKGYPEGDVVYIE